MNFWHSLRMGLIGPVENIAKMGLIWLEMQSGAIPAGGDKHRGQHRGMGQITVGTDWYEMRYNAGQ